MPLTPKQKKKRYIILGSVAGGVILLILFVILYIWRSNLSHRRFIYSALTKGADWKANLPIDPPEYPTTTDPTEDAKLFKDHFTLRGVGTSFIRVNKDSKETPIIYVGNDTEGIPLKDEYGHDFLTPTGRLDNFVMNFGALSEHLLPQSHPRLAELGMKPEEHCTLGKDFRQTLDTVYRKHHSHDILLLDPELTFGHTKTESGDVVLYDYWIGDSKIFSSVKDLPKCVVAYVYCKLDNDRSTKYSDIFWWSVTDECNDEEKDSSPQNHVVIRKAFNNPKKVPWTAQTIE